MLTEWVALTPASLVAAQVSVVLAVSALTVLEGRDAMMAYVKEAVKTLKTIHHVYSPLITFHGPDEATGVWQMDDRLLAPHGDGWSLVLQGYGHYHETYVNTPRGWKIASLELRRLLVEKV